MQCASERLGILKLLEQSFRNELTAVSFEKNVQPIISRKLLKKKWNEFLKAGKDKTVLSPSQMAYFSLLVERKTH